jgi:hypothetical protein
VSVDEGGTWRTGDINLGELTNPSETAAVQLRDGRVMMNIRSERVYGAIPVAGGRNGNMFFTHSLRLEKIPAQLLSR